jgi:hypothetical protein
MSCCDKLKKKIKTGHEHFKTSSAHSEKGKRIEIDVRDGKDRLSVCKVIIDGGFISDPTKEKCDCLFYLCKTDKYIFVELKGNTWPKPYEQIVSTLNYFKNDLNIKIEKANIEACIVYGSRSPKTGNDRNTKKDEFRKKHGSVLHISQTEFVYTV